MPSAQAPIILTAQRSYAYRKYPPFGILYVAGALRKAGFKVKIVHPVKDRPKAVMEAVKRDKPVFVGLSVIHTPLLSEDIEISKMLKEAGVPVVWGGIYPSMVPEIALAADYVDYVLTGEAELTAPELADTIASGKRPDRIPGAGYMEDGKAVVEQCGRFSENLDNFEPAWDLLKLGEYLEVSEGGASRLMMVPLSRGCPFRCAFCYNQSNPDRRKYRVHGADWVLRQVDFLQKRLAANAVRWIGDNPFGKRRQGMKIIEKVGLPWVAASRIEIINEEFCDWLKRSKCRYLGFGFESGSKKVLNILNKDVTPEQMERGVRNLDQCGIYASASWIHLVPHETDEDRRETREFMDHLHGTYSNIFHDIGGLRPYPGTPIWHDALKIGMKPPRTNEEWASWQSLTAPHLGWSDKRLWRLIMATRLLYGRPGSAGRIVPDWLYALERRRFLKGMFRGPVEDRMAKNNKLRPHLVEE